MLVSSCACPLSLLGVTACVMLIFASVSVILTAAIFLGGYWYVRNYTMFDNPFYPTDFRICGKLYFGDGLRHGAQQGAFKPESVSQNFKDLMIDTVKPGFLFHNQDVQ